MLHQKTFLAPFSSELVELLIRAYGNKEQASHAVGLASSTLKRWHEGTQQPSVANLLQVIETAPEVSYFIRGLFTESEYWMTIIRQAAAATEPN